VLPALTNPEAWLPPWLLPWLTGPDAWLPGLAAALATGLLLWPIGARLLLLPTSRAAAIALYAVAALSIDTYAPLGADGRAAFLLAAAAWLAVHGRWRAVLAALAAAGAVVLSPLVGVGFLVLVGGLALQAGLVRRWTPRWRRAAAVLAFASAAALAASQVRAMGPPALPPLLLAVLTAWTLLVVGLLWRRQPWLRPVGAALGGVLACAWLPGTESATAVVVAAAVALLTVVLVEEYRTLLARQLLAASVAAGAVALALIGPGTSPARLAQLVEAGPAPGPAGPPEPVVMAARPVGLSVPALGIDGPLEELGADPVTRELAAPDDPSVAGWYAAGVVPGDTGPAVVGGHVDSRAGPGVFFGLRGLVPGDLVEIRRSDGRTARFTVTDVRLYPKDRFPTEAVYGPAPAPELRLVTCGGTFDRAERSYADNVVVNAVLASG
jgi:Sortase domain